VIGFVTLFLGVFCGIREVEVAVAVEVARVELQLTTRWSRRWRSRRRPT
jgi:hypothetical protein